MILLVCPLQAGIPAASTPITAQNDASKSSSVSDKALYFLLTILPGATGTFQVYLAKAGTIYNPNISFVVTSSDDTAYIDCGFAGKSSSENPDLGCSYVPFSYKMTQQMFGKGVADRLIVVQVTVRNKNKDYEYLLQDIRLGAQGTMVASLDKKLARRISENTEQFSARAIAFRLVEAGGTVLAGISGVVGNGLLTEASTVFTPAQAGLHQAIPDLSTAEINTIDDNGFSVESTVIPKNSAIAVVAFLSSEAFAPGKFKDLTGSDLIAFQLDLRVQIAGIHIQQVNLTPTLTAIISQDPSIGAGTLSANATVVLGGTGLTSVDSVLLQQTGSQPVPPIKLKSNTGQTSLDPNTDTIVIPKGTLLSSGDYTLSLITTAGATVQPTPPVTLKVPGLSFTAAIPATISAGAQSAMIATVIDDSTNKGVDWTCTPNMPAGSCGTFNPMPAHTDSGKPITYTAPPSPPASTVAITAALTANSAVTITAAPLTTISPAPGGGTVICHHGGPASNC